ncbi:amidase [Halalkalibacter alkalisediminis]|uniref:Amidase n=1 Tax=Halalkalibacter alkalisediminis TaxID=935616 RepID=A0ABV6NDT5_9BACI|nr:amidase [Halalkalibacter alkalisediminis]
MSNQFNVYINETLEVEPLQEGELSGYTFAVKDVFAIKGITASAGNPDWLKTHEPAKLHATAVHRLLSAGAKLHGTTITDELMYSLNGENFHYGTPVNPKAKGRIPGGSSSGSAVAVSAHLVDFALGTDTGGSVRVPSAYCGLFGFRPTHGLVAIDGVIPLAESFDTVGWMARDAKVLMDVGNQLMSETVSADEDSFSTLLLGKDAWRLADYESRSTLSTYIDALITDAEISKWLDISEEGLEEWAKSFRILQGIEIWKTHGEWIEKYKPVFGPDIEARFKWASTLTDAEGKLEQKVRDLVRIRMKEMIGEDKLLIIPTTPGKAPLCQLSGGEIEKRRSQTMQLSCIAGLVGLPQVTIPFRGGDGIPISLSIIAGLNQDKKLLRWVYENKEIWKQD